MSAVATPESAKTPDTALMAVRSSAWLTNPTPLPLHSELSTFLLLLGPWGLNLLLERVGEQAP